MPMQTNLYEMPILIHHCSSSVRPAKLRSISSQVTRIDDQGAYIFGAAVQGKKWMRASRKECAFPDGPSDLVGIFAIKFWLIQG
ncbi:hypothetical protein C5167_006571 [Papaver somniferum]|uniref:Uncharacterized protein n=1 Tax=Papaver somniferum TaxID=3469 RepID=A0A4Y7JH63_PAPSO|nr:hypothetical protein C5167_006571 [Papaver somniferum]